MNDSCDLTVLMAINKVDNFTKEAIESILCQTFDSFRFKIICNGLDAVRVENWISKEYKDKRIETIKVTIPGLANALNLGISSIDTEFIARMDADDISFPQRFEKQIEYLRDNPEIGVLGCNVDLIDGAGKKLTDKFIHFSTHRQIVRWLPVFNSMCHPSLMFRTKCLKDLGGYKYGFHSEDHELFIRIAQETKWQFANLKSVLFSYRRHENQITGGGSLKVFSEVSGFLIMNLFKSGNLLFLIGVLWVSPPINWLKKIIRSTIRYF